MYAMLSLDLERGTTSDQRQDFYDRLEADKYTKQQFVSTTWQARFNYDDPDAIYTQIVRELRAHAKAAGIKAFDAVVQIGNSKADWFDQAIPALERKAG